MRIGIITLHASNNYGAVLQTYALQTWLEQGGNDVEIVDYRPLYFRGGYCPSVINIHNWRTVIRTLAIRSAKIICDHFPFGDALNFVSFRKDRLHITGRRYQNINELREDPPDLDALVCGSDQIWNIPPSVGVDPAYYLDFAPESTIRIAYAASCGKPAIDPQWHNTLRPFLMRIRALSVRESANLSTISDMCPSKQIEWMPDPTLLPIDYGAITDIPDEVDPYIFSYMLESGSLAADTLEYITQKLKCPIISPKLKRIQSKNVTRKSMTPERWLGYIQKAEVIVTNSFHGTIFSILMRKPFITLALEHTNTNERFISLFNRLGIGDRLLTRFDSISVDNLLNSPPDWEIIAGRLRSWQAEAETFIRKALSE